MKCNNCNRITTFIPTGFRKFGENQRYKCSVCHTELKPKRFFGLFLLVLSLSLLLLLPNVTSLSTTGTVNWNSNVGQIREDAYGVYTGYFISNQTWLDSNGDGANDIRSNITWNKENLLDMKFKIFRRDTNINYYYQGWNGTNWNYTSSSSEMKSIHFYDVKWAYENNLKFLYVGSRTPEFMVNTTTGWCTIGSSNATCSPKDYNLYANMTVDFLRNISNNGTYQNALMYECKNEVNSNTNYLNNLTSNNNTRIIEIIKLCNETYVEIKRQLPNITLVTPSIAFSLATPEVFYPIMANLSNIVDAYEYHSYTGAKLGERAFTDLDNIIKNMTLYNIPRKWLILGEFNIQSQIDVTNASTKQNWSLQNSTFSSVFTNVLNLYPNISIIPYKWNERFLYNESNYPEYPDFYNMVYEPAMNITKYNQSYYYPLYYISRLYTHNHKALNYVVTSSITDSTVKIVASKDSNGQKYITLTNTNTSAFNVTLRTNVAMRNVETNTIYPVNSSGDIYIPNMASYGVTTLTSVNTTVISLSSTSLGQISSNFWGASGFQSSFGNDAVSYNSIDTDGNGATDTPINSTWLKEKWVASKLKVWREDAQLDASVNNSLWRATSWLNTRYNRHLNSSKYAYDNNFTKIIVLGDMPAWLANTTTGYCTHGTNISCPPKNYTAWGQLVLDYLNFTTNDGQYKNNIVLELLNEPYGARWLNNLSQDNIIKGTEYMKLWNATRSALENSKYQNVSLGGPSGYRDAPNLTKTFLTNASDNQGFDFVSIHPYKAAGDGKTYVEQNDLYIDFVNIKNNCTSLGLTCNIWATEWNENLALLMNQSVNQSRFASSISNVYASVLNNYPESSLVFYSFHEFYKYGAYSSDYPKKYMMLSEPRLDNFEASTYNLSKAYTRYAPAQGTIYNTTITDEGNVIKVVSSKINNKQNLIITNTENGQRNITLSCGSFTGNLIDVSSGELYSCASGSVNLGVTDEYEVRYLTEPVEANGAWYNYLGEYLAPVSGYSIGSTCDPTTISFYQIILNLSGLAIIAVVLYLIFKDGWEDITIQQMLIAGIAIIVGVILFQQSAVNLGIGNCP